MLSRRNPRPALVPTLILVLALATVACEETSPVVSEIGTTQLLILDSRNVAQGLENTGNAIQDVRWRIQQATLTLPGQTLDLLFNDVCEFYDTPFITGGVGPCANAVVIDSGDDPVPATLDLVLTMDVSRAVPLVLPPLGDFDADGILNDGDLSGAAGDNPCVGGNTVGCDDNCALAANPAQLDSNLDGFGDACSFFDAASGRTSVDSDLDRVSDLVDNCLWIPNSDQENTTGLAAEGIPDGIGDACPSQSADVSLAMNMTMQFSVTTSLLQGSAGTALTVDFNSAASLTCDWNGGTCMIDPAQVRFCALASNVVATLGCP